MKTQQIIDARKKLDHDIAKYWNIIYNENVINKNTGATRNYNLKNLLDEILTLMNKRVELKLDSICINMGYKSRKEMPKDCLYPTIYQLSEFAEFLVKLGKIPTIKSGIKVKLGKSNVAETEELTNGYLGKLRNSVTLRKNALVKHRDTFNDKAELDTSGGYMYQAYAYTKKAA